MGSSAYFEVHTVRNVQIWQFSHFFSSYSLFKAINKSRLSKLEEDGEKEEQGEDLKIKDDKQILNFRRDSKKLRRLRNGVD